MPLAADVQNALDASQRRLEALGHSPTHMDFLESINLNNLCDDWTPFRQSDFIRDNLHGRLPNKSRHSDGVCNEISLVAMEQWLTHGTSADVIANIDRLATAERIDELAQSAAAFEGGDQEFFRQTLVVKPQRESRSLTFRGGVEDIVGRGQCSFMVHGRGDRVGHTILVDGSTFAIFDPNIGYMKMNSEDKFKAAFELLLTKFYPEFMSVAKTSGVAVMEYKQPRP
jgi:hypothetical protein